MIEAIVLTVSNPKNLPVVQFVGGKPSNAHELLKDVPFVASYTRRRRRLAWVERENALWISSYGVRYWGEIEIVEEQTPKRYNAGGFTLGYFEITRETFRLVSPNCTWSVNDLSTLD